MIELDLSKHDKQAVEIRVLTPGEIDIAATVAVLNAAFRRHAILLRDRTSAVDITGELYSASRLIQAFEHGELTGTATMTARDDAHTHAGLFPGIDIRRAMYFGMAGVRPDRMGLGIGGRLLTECEQIARDEGYTHIILTTVEEMGNVQYYQRFGYQTVSVHALAAGYWGFTVATHEHGMAKRVV